MLPIFDVREQFFDAVVSSQVTVLVGTTGSGKTTRLPPFLHEFGFADDGVIGITQPRQIAATSVAGFVAEQLGVEIGTKVGYQIRFDDITNRHETEIKFMTDGILLREMQLNPNLSRYSVIMVDEAHERSRNIDFLLGLLKDLLVRRPDFKLVVSSATIDAEKFSAYFGGAPVIEVPGRLHPVEVVWSDRDFWCLEDVAREVVDRVKKINENRGPGDILVFLAGADEIDNVITRLEELDLRDAVLLPAHGGLAPQDQQKIFQSFPGRRKVVLATNIAETSITIDGVVYVIDSGRIKQIQFNPKTGIQALEVVEHSQAGCEQRAGRAGRTQPGICFRLYTEGNFGRRPEFTTPEIQRMDLAGVVLTMESLGIKNVEGFDFIDPPDRGAFKQAYQTLISLGAISKDGSSLTEIGKAMARIPLEPRISRMILAAVEYGCIRDIITVAAFLSVEKIFARPKGKNNEADQAHAAFKDERSDALTFLRIWRQYEKCDFSRQWCFDHFLNSRSLWEVKQIRDQLFRILERLGVDANASNGEESVLKSVAAGLIHNLLLHQSRGQYTGVVQDNLFDIRIHPGSAMFNFLNPSWIVTAGVVETTRRFARFCSEVDVNWLPELLPSHFSLGELAVTEYKPGSESATVGRPIIYTGRFEQRVVGKQSYEVPVAEAQLIQDRAVEKAKAKGSKLGRVWWDDRSLGRLAAVDGEGLLKVVFLPAYSTPLDKEVFCICEVRVDGLERRANPQFRIFNFGLGLPRMNQKRPAPVQAEVEKPGGEPEKKVVITDAIAALTKAWDDGRLQE